jgi:hypothetical protein
MTQHVLQLWPQIAWVAGGVVVLLLFALAVALPHRPKVLPGSSGHREAGDEFIHEEIHPDGYIDSFARDIEEAGGGLPLVVRIALPGVLLWWLIYLIVFWTEH